MALTLEKVGNLKLECVVTSCSKQLEITEVEAKEAGWKRICDSKNPPADKKWRTHLGWCPECATKFGILNPSEERKEDAKEVKKEETKKEAKK